MAFCLTKPVADEFIARIKSGVISPEKLVEMTSEQRRTLFAEFMGELTAREVNALFESKLLLKNQQQGIIGWAKRVGNLKPGVQRDIINKVNRLGVALTPETEQRFLEDLVSQRLGVGVTLEEAGIIAELSKRVTQTKAKIDSNSPNGSPDRLEYGRARVEFGNYLSDLKNSAARLTLSDLRQNPLGTFGKSIVKSAGMLKSIKASLDNSALFRQGLKTLITNPSIWLRNALQSFRDIIKTFGGKEVMDEVHADLLSRKNALNGLYQREKLAINVAEEAYPATIQEKLPIIGKAFKASDVAFTAFIQRNRADVFDKLVEMAEGAGGETKGLGIIANSLTGRGDLGILESSANTINNLFFSPRFMKSNIDTLTGHITDYKKLGTFAKKQASINTLKIIMAIAGLLAIAKALSPKSVELDARSADFGKIKEKNTRFDISGGMSSLVTLAARLATKSTKSSTSGRVYPLNEKDKKGNLKFGAQTTGDVIQNFFTNKLSPAVAIAYELYTGLDRSGKDISPRQFIKDTLEPISFANYEELKNNPNSANIILAIILDGLGIGTNTYGK